jgi:hypothetical protein
VATGKSLISTELRLGVVVSRRRWQRILTKLFLRNLRQILLAMAAVADERLRLFNAVNEVNLLSRPDCHRCGLPLPAQGGLSGFKDVTES